MNSASGRVYTGNVVKYNIFLAICQLISWTYINCGHPYTWPNSCQQNLRMVANGTWTQPIAEKQFLVDGCLTFEDLATVEVRIIFLYTKWRCFDLF